MSHHRRRFVRTRVWSTEEKPGFFPEIHDSELKVPWLDEKRRRFGVAFSGGANRSAAATLGQLRGLRAAGLLDKIGYVSAVSGGAWASAPFTYLPKELDEGVFLGRYKPPEKLRPSDLTRAPKGSLALAVSQSVIVDDILKEAFKLGGDEVFARVVGNVFLEPFDLADRGKFFTFHSGARDAVVAGNSVDDHESYYLKPEDFYTVREGRPYLIAGSTILRLRGTGHSQKKMQCEYTPLYSGVRQHFPGAGRSGAPIGGGYLESYAFDSQSPREPWGHRWLVKVGRRRFRFTLSDMIGSSGAAPQEVAERSGFDFLGFPEFRHWPIVEIGKVEHEEYGHGDGGLLENLGLMPLLARQVEKIIVFINTKDRFDLANDQYNDSLAPLFTPVTDDEERVSGFRGTKGTKSFATNVVFDHGAKKLKDLLAGLERRQDAEEPLVYGDTYDVVANEHYRIRPYTVKICWVYNERVESWKRALKDDTRKVVEGRGFKNFPHYQTFFENPPRILDLSRSQVNALAHLASWVVVRETDRIAECLDL